MIVNCEACTTQRATEDWQAGDAESVFRLCAACRARLEARALRPSEWYSLASRYGWWHHDLHDDLYDESGHAAQPQEPVASPECFPALTLSAVAEDAAALFAYTVSRWHIEASVVDAWTRLPREDVLHIVSERLAEAPNGGVRAVALDIAAEVLGESGRDFVDAAWKRYPDSIDLRPLAHATAACLPHEEGFDRVADALAALDGRQRGETFPALAYFRSQRSLEWIERNVEGGSHRSVGTTGGVVWPRLETRNQVASRGKAAESDRARCVVFHRETRHCSHSGQSAEIDR